MRHYPLFVAIAAMLFGFVAWPDLCARGADCCRKGACPMKMQAGSCHDHQDVKNAVIHFERATMSGATLAPLPRIAAMQVVAFDDCALAGFSAVADHPPRTASPLR